MRRFIGFMSKLERFLYLVGFKDLLELDRLFSFREELVIVKFLGG